MVHKYHARKPGGDLLVPYRKKQLYHVGKIDCTLDTYLVLTRGVLKGRKGGIVFPEGVQPEFVIEYQNVVDAWVFR